MILVHRKNPKYIVQLIEKGCYGRWICAVLSGEPAKSANGVMRIDVPREASPGLKRWLAKDGQMMVQYSTSAFSNCFEQSELGQVLYMEEPNDP
jgi:hypothetical protein